jgi:hypothetical protein
MGLSTVNLSPPPDPPTKEGEAQKLITGFHPQVPYFLMGQEVGFSNLLWMPAFAGITNMSAQFLQSLQRIPKTRKPPQNARFDL